MIRPEDLGTLFTLFHDGVLAGATRDDDTLVLTVDIRYLAQRVHPDHHAFTVRLLDASPVVFFPWGSSPDDRADPIEPADHLLGADLDILEGAVKDGALVVTCSGSVPYRGGDLVLQAVPGDTPPLLGLFPEGPGGAGHVQPGELADQVVVGRRVP